MRELRFTESLTQPLRVEALLGLFAGAAGVTFNVNAELAPLSTSNSMILETSS